MEYFLISSVIVILTITLMITSIIFYKMLTKINDNILILRESVAEATDNQVRATNQVSAEISTVRLSVSKLNSKSSHKTTQTKNLLNLASALNDS